MAAFSASVDLHPIAIAHNSLTVYNQRLWPTMLTLPFRPTNPAASNPFPGLCIKSKAFPLALTNPPPSRLFTCSEELVSGIEGPHVASKEDDQQVEQEQMGGGEEEGGGTIGQL